VKLYLRKSIKKEYLGLKHTIYIFFKFTEGGYSMEQETKERNTPPLEELKIEIHPQN